ncbi:hypothetical protein VTH06DRAFT_3132 [Thermothelomyces fergusii]
MAPRHGCFVSQIAAGSVTNDINRRHLFKFSDSSGVRLGIVVSLRKGGLRQPDVWGLWKGDSFRCGNFAVSRRAARLDNASVIISMGGGWLVLWMDPDPNFWYRRTECVIMRPRGRISGPAQVGSL